MEPVLAGSSKRMASAYNAGDGRLLRRNRGSRQPQQLQQQQKEHSAQDPYHQQHEGGVAY